jgi:hypothetical protein
MVCMCVSADGRWRVGDAVDGSATVKTCSVSNKTYNNDLSSNQCCRSGSGFRDPVTGIWDPVSGIWEPDPGYGIRYPLSGIRDKVFSDPDQTHISESSGNKFLNDEQFKIKQQL